MVLRVYVLTGAAAVQSGAAAAQSASAAHQATVTTTVTGSRVYGACVNGAAASPTVVSAATTLADAILDSGHAKDYATCKATSATGTPGATLLGFTDSNNGGIALFEVLPAGTVTEDASGPAVVSTTAASTLTTASFTPPDGSLLVALVASNGATSGTVTMALSGGGVTWSAKAEANASNMKYAGVWIAQVAAGGATPPLQAARRAASRAPALPSVRRYRQVLPVPRQLSPPYLFTETAQRRETWPRGLLPRRGRGFTPVPAQQAAAPNPAIAFWQPKHQRMACWRRGRTVMPVPAQQQAPAPPVAWQRPGHLRVLLPRRGRGAAPVPSQDVLPQQAPGRRRVPYWRRGRAVVPAPPQAAVPNPAIAWQQARHQRAVFWRRGRAASPVPVQQPAPANPVITFWQPRRQRMVLGRRGRVAAPPPVPAAAPALVLPHRSPLRALALIRRRFRQLLPWPQAAGPSFTAGTLTASGAPSGTLTAGGASSALTAATAPGSTLTAGTTTTGGPS
jgi:hypothetical protein